jgi:hypothetical protein
MACALMHAMTGAPPFERDSVGGLFGAHLFVTPTVDDGNASEQALLKALAKEPRDRYATCGQLLSDMTRAGQSAANRRRSDTRRGRAVEPGWLNDGGESTLAAPPAATSTLTDESSVVISLPAHDDEPVPADHTGDAPARGPRSPAPVAGPPPAEEPGTVQVDPGGESQDVPPPSTDDEATVSAPEAGGRSGAEDDAPEDPVADDARTASVPVAAVDADNEGTASAPVPVATHRQAPAAGVDRSTMRADSALSNGERSVPARARAGVEPVEKSSTTRRSTADIAYAAAEDGPEPAPVTESAEDLDDVPLLSEVLSRRPYHPEPAARRHSAALVGLIILAVIALAVTVWLIAS